MNQVEYKVVRIRPINHFWDEEYELTEKELNKWAKEGWYVVCLLATPPKGGHFSFLLGKDWEVGNA